MCGNHVLSRMQRFLFPMVVPASRTISACADKLNELTLTLTHP